MTISVIGTVFVDIKGHSYGRVNAETKNVGYIEYAHGGVGRNVAEAIGRAGAQTEFITSVDLSAEGDSVVRRLNDLGIATNHVIKTERGMGSWLAVIDSAGELCASISQVPDMSPLERMLIEKGEEIVQNSQAIVLEFDLHEEAVNKVFGWAKQHGKPVYGIVGNLDVIMHRRNIIDHLDLFICNKAEAEEFLGRTLTSVEECKLAARDLTNGGLRVAVITMGGEGSVFYDSRNGQFGYVPVQKVTVADTTGAGDSFFSGTVYGLVQGYELERAVACGTQLAAWTISSKHNVDPEIQEKVKHNPLFQAEPVLN